MSRANAPPPVDTRRFIDVKELARVREGAVVVVLLAVSLRRERPAPTTRRSFISTSFVRLFGTHVR